MWVRMPWWEDGGQRTSPQVFLFPLESGIWHQTCCQTCWAILSAPTVCIAISFQITWMLTDRWPMDHRFSSSDTGSLLSNEIFFVMVEMLYICGYRALKVQVVQLQNRTLSKNKLQFNSHRCPAAKTPDSTDLTWTSTVSTFSTTAVFPNEPTHQFISTV